MEGIRMQTAVIGFPRIGSLRELKFVLERYFRKESSEEELLKTAKELRKAHWTTQKQAGIDYISSNDFSFYDLTLDTAVMLGIVPARYKNLKLSKLDTYFAMARGHQDAGRDVKALAMKKWFNTNYHYIVPEIEDDTVIALCPEKLFEEYEEAKTLGITTKPVVIGAYTMLKLCRYTGEKKAADYVEAVTKAYQELLGLCAGHQIDWIQFDEPALVKDMGKEDISFFHQIYDAILPAKKQCHVLLQTYFGDIRDVYEDVCAMPFDGIGLDFIEGKQTRQLVEEKGFPKEKLAKEAVCYFAFAEEKLLELQQLRALAECEDAEKEAAYQTNQELFAKKRDCENQEVTKRLSQVTEKDYVRLPERKVRQQLQKEELALPEFPTTTIGSFPQTKDVKSNRAAYRKGHITEQEYVDFNKKKIAECVAWQEEIVSALKQMLSKIERDKLWVNLDCGLKTRGVPETEAGLENMVEAARQIRQL